MVLGCTGHPACSGAVQASYRLEDWNPVQMGQVREKIEEALNNAEQGDNKDRTAVLRLINAAVHHKDFTERSKGYLDGIPDAVIIGILRHMRRQRLESSKHFEEHWRVDLAARDRFEISVIDELLPRTLSQFEHQKAVEDIINEIGATGIRDRGRVIKALRVRYSEQLDLDRTGRLVNDALCSTLKQSVRRQGV